MAGFNSGGVDLAALSDEGGGEKGAGFEGEGERETVVVERGEEHQVVDWKDFFWGFGESQSSQEGVDEIGFQGFGNAGLDLGEFLGMDEHLIRLTVRSSSFSPSFFLRGEKKKAEG